MIANRPDTDSGVAAAGSVANSNSGLVATAGRIANSNFLHLFIIGVILFNALVIGLETYPSIDSKHGSTLELLNDILLWIFVVELTIRLTAFGLRPDKFFYDGWNVFDFVVIAAAFIPGLQANAMLLRLVRLLRVFRLASALSGLRILVTAMLRSLRPIGYISLLSILVMYVYGVIGWSLFHDSDPERWGTVGSSMLSLFTVLTLEGWDKFLFAGIKEHPWSWVYFVSFVLIATFVLVNMIIGVIIESLQEAHAIDKKEHAKPGEVGVDAEVFKLREALNELELKLQVERRSSG